LGCLDGQPLEELAQSIEGADDALVDRSFEPSVGLAQCVEYRERRHFCVLGPFARLTTLAWMRLSSRSLRAAPSAATGLSRLRSSLVLSRADHRRAPAVDLDDENLAVVVRRCHGLEKGSCLSADRIDDSQSAARARHPLAEGRKDTTGSVE